MCVKGAPQGPHSFSMLHPSPEGKGAFPSSNRPGGPDSAANPTRPFHTRGLPPAGGQRAPRAAPAPVPRFPTALPELPGGMDGAAGCPGRLPAPGCCCFCSRAAAAAGACCGSRRRGCGSAGGSTLWAPGARPVCAIELLIHGKKGGERKKRSHMSGLYVCGEAAEGGKNEGERGRGRKRSGGGSGGGARGGGGGAAGDGHPPV